MLIRVEKESDRDAVKKIHASAFESHIEAKMVDLLREQAEPLVSLIAEEGGKGVGHVLFSPASLQEHPALNVMGLAPMAVLPEQQGKGAGFMLVQQGLEQCRKLGAEAVIVLGHPDYYPRFGFRPASYYGIDSDYEVPDEAFMVLELLPGALYGKSGRAEFHPVFKQL